MDHKNDQAHQDHFLVGDESQDRTTRLLQCAEQAVDKALMMIRLDSIGWELLKQRDDGILVHTKNFGLEMFPIVRGEGEIPTSFENAVLLLPTNNSSFPVDTVKKIFFWENLLSQLI